MKKYEVDIRTDEQRNADEWALRKTAKREALAREIPLSLTPGIPQGARVDSRVIAQFAVKLADAFLAELAK